MPETLFKDGEFVSPLAEIKFLIIMLNDEIKTPFDERVQDILQLIWNYLNDMEED